MRRSPRSMGHGPQAGFTLVEVIIALAIVALAVVPLIIQNGLVMRDTVETRNKRVAWVLLSHKMAELEIDPSVLADGTSEQGDFREYDEAYSDFLWTWEAVIEEVPTNDPDNAEEEPKEILRVTVTVTWDGGVREESRARLTAYFDAPEEGNP